jgi:PleD family two-component response regulator
MDVVMPVMDGFSACSKLRELEEGARVPILIMTALDDADSIVGAYEHGATDLHPTMNLPFRSPRPLSDGFDRTILAVNL